MASIVSKEKKSFSDRISLLDSIADKMNKKNGKKIIN